jgi:hypothetical protein
MSYGQMVLDRREKEREAQTKTPFELGQARSLNSGSKFYRKLYDNMARQNFGTYGDPEFSQYLDGLNAGAAADVATFYGVGGYQDHSQPFYQGGVGSGQINTAYNPYANINVNRYDHLNKKDNPADKLYADLIRAQTADYEKRFAPIERFMADQITATGTKSLEGDLTRTRQAVLQAGANVEGQQQRAMERMGIGYSPASQNNQSTVSSLVGGLNDTRMRDADRRQAMLSGNLGALSQKARGAIS